MVKRSYWAITRQSHTNKQLTVLPRKLANRIIIKYRGIPSALLWSGTLPETQVFTSWLYFFSCTILTVVYCMVVWKRFHCRDKSLASGEQQRPDCRLTKIQNQFHLVHNQGHDYPEEKFVSINEWDYWISDGRRGYIFFYQVFSYWHNRICEFWQFVIQYFYPINCRVHATNNTGFLIVWNVGNQRKTLSFNDVRYISNDMTVIRKVKPEGSQTWVLMLNAYFYL